MPAVYSAIRTLKVKKVPGKIVRGTNGVFLRAHPAAKSGPRRANPCPVGFAGTGSGICRHSSNRGHRRVLYIIFNLRM